MGDDLKIEIFIPVYINTELTKYSISDYGTCINTKTRQVIQPEIRYPKKGKRQKTRIYLRLCHKGITYKKQVSRWVALSHLPNPPGDIDEYEVDHIDSDPLNNFVENLQWLTPEDNRKEAMVRGDILYGSTHPCAQLNEDVVHLICRDIESGELMKNIANKYNISLDTIFYIKKGKLWRRIGCMYDLMSKYNPRQTYIKYSKQIKQKVLILLYKNMTYREIAKQLDFEWCDTIRHMITRVDNNRKSGLYDNMKSSTTIERDPNKLYIDIYVD